MGLEELFSENAQLPYMINNNQGKVSAMVHKAKIEVSEKGTKAVAASGKYILLILEVMSLKTYKLNLQGGACRVFLRTQYDL